MSSHPVFPPDLDDTGFDADDDFGLDPAAAAPPVPAAAPAPAAARDPFAFQAPAEGEYDDLYADDVYPMDEIEFAAPAPVAAAVDPRAPVSAPSMNPVGEMIADAEQALGELSVPRIVIHVFCKQPGVRVAAEQAAEDRRLARATTRIFAGGLPAALEHYVEQSTPPLLILDSDQPPAELLADLDRLAEVCDSGTKVIVIGASNDIGFYRELMKRGVSEYLVAPVQTLQLIRTITGLYADPAAPFVGRSIAFVGAKGGVGASTVAHNIAYAISERLMAPTVIVDFDLPFGTAGLDFNQDPLQGVADALSQPDRLDPVLLERMMVRCTERLSLFAAPATLDSTYDISTEAFEEVASKIRSTSPYVVLDLPHLWSGWMRQTLLSADDVVIVCTPDLASLRNAKNMIDLIRVARPHDAPPRLVLNQVGVPGRPEIPVKDFAEALGVEPSLVLPFDPKTFGQAANNGQMVLESGAKSKAAEGLEHLASLISKREAPPARSKTFLEGILKRTG
jgi:pilus assembly protein CpaE